MSEGTFSERRGYYQPPTDIKFREDAPGILRSQVFSLALKHNLGVSKLRDLVCERILEIPDQSNWSENNGVRSWDCS
jgi:hypothetical protein